MTTKRGTVAAMFLLLLAGAGCGGDGDGEANADENPDANADEGVALIVSTAGAGFDRRGYTAAAGELPVILRNGEGQVHSLVFEGREGDLRLEVTENGDEARGTINVEPGSYIIYCDVAGHREGGMQAAVEVLVPPAPAAPPPTTAPPPAN